MGKMFNASSTTSRIIFIYLLPRDKPESNYYTIYDSHYRAYKDKINTSL